MNKEIVSEMVDDIINDKITQFVENISCNEFIEEVTDKLIQGGVEIDVHDEEQIEKVKEIIGGQVVGFLTKTILPKN